MGAFDESLAHRAKVRQTAGLTRTCESSHDDGLIDLAGNDYLALRRHPRVAAAAIDALQRFGTGAGASRLVTGTWPVHDDLEQALADHMGGETALVMSTGYHANLAVLTALCDSETLIVSDAHNHASLVDGSRLAKAAVTVTAHGDLCAVEEALARRAQPKALVVVESVFSVLGDAAPLADLRELVSRYDAWLLVDEAHGLGVVGEGGEGLCHALGLADDPRVLRTVTLSKSLASQGGCFVGSRLVREHLINAARPFIFDTGLAPASAGAALGALGVLRDEPERVRRVRAAAASLARTCGVETPAGAVLSVPMAGPHEAMTAVESCRAAGLRIGCFRPPSTPDGSSRLRLTASAGLGEATLRAAASALHGILDA